MQSCQTKEAKLKSYQTIEAKWPKPIGYKNKTQYGHIADGVWRVRRRHWCSGCGCGSGWKETWKEGVTEDEVIRFWQCTNCAYLEPQRYPHKRL
jgi:hypothetical protein